jgi:hypothetical protein
MPQRMLAGLIRRNGESSGKFALLVRRSATSSASDQIDAEERRAGSRSDLGAPDRFPDGLGDDRTHLLRHNGGHRFAYPGLLSPAHVRTSAAVERIRARKTVSPCRHSLRTMSGVAGVLRMISRTTDLADQVAIGPAPLRWTVSRLLSLIFSPSILHPTRSLPPQAAAAPGGFFLRSAENRLRIKVQERRSRSTPGVDIPANSTLQRFCVHDHAASLAA